MWTHKNTFAVGGLQNVGFADKGDFLLVLSSQGMGIFNCLTGEKLGRKYEEWWQDFNEEEFSIKGFYFLSDSTIKTCGMYGQDVLNKKTADGWVIEDVAKFFGSEVVLISPDHAHRISIEEDEPCELRAFGFSETGKSLIVATSCQLTIWARE